MQLYIVAGEMSGDKHGALLLKEFHSLLPNCSLKGFGGPLMNAQSSNIEDWVENAAVVGVVEVLRHYGFFRKKFLSLLDEIKKNKPELLLLIDYPGFNLRLAEAVHKACPKTKIVYFISPQVWAWHKGRIPKMAKILDLMLCIFPFEKPLFQKSGLPTEFVGHPLVDDIASKRTLGIRHANLIGLFPGSRKREIERHFPIMLETVKSLQTLHPEWHYEVSASSSKMEELMLSLYEKHGLSEKDIPISKENYHRLMDKASAGIVASGTATMEAALHELPYVLVYKLNPITYCIARCVVTIKHIGMVNILANKSIITELIQNDFTPNKTIQELEKLMSPESRQEILNGMKASVDMLGPGGAARRAAKEIVNLFKSSASS